MLGIDVDHSDHLINSIHRKNAKYKEIKDQNDTLVYIHIGKCGGISLWKAIKNSAKVKREFKSIHKLHICKPPVLTDARYLIVIRDPIDRAISAFNWRYKIVIEDGNQRNRFRGEYKVLKKYPSLNELAEALYSSELILNKKVASEFNKIHHLKENISYYIYDLLDELKYDQIYSVMSTETLDEDIARDLNVEEVKRVHSNKKNTQSDRLFLSETAKSHLRLFLDKDYASIKRLLEKSSRNGKRAEVPFEL